MRKKILIEVILTNQCNKKCEYCDLNFSDTLLKDIYIDFLIQKIKNAQGFNFHLNFFGGEPLLALKKIKYIVEQLKNQKNITYSIGTNGILLNEAVLHFFHTYNFKIYLSIDNITGSKFLKISNIQEIWKKNIYINFIVDPDYIYKSKILLQKIVTLGFKNVNFMPVFSTKKWNNQKLVELGKLLKIIQSSYTLNLKTFSYFNGISKDMQFILDTDGCFYNDLDSLLWLQKQYNSINQKLKLEIQKDTKNISIINKEFSFDLLLKNYNIKKIIRLIWEIPKQQGLMNSYAIIDKIFKNV